MLIGRARGMMVLMMAASGACLMAGCSAQEQKAEPERKAEATRAASVTPQSSSGELIPPETTAAAPATTDPPRTAGAIGPKRTPPRSVAAATPPGAVAAKAVVSRPRSVRSTGTSEEPEAGVPEIGPPPPVPGPTDTSAPDAAEQAGCTTMKVYYATDRAPLVTPDAAAPAYAAWLAAALASCGTALILIAVGQRHRGKRWMRGLSTLAVGATLVLVVRTAYAAWRDASTSDRSEADSVDYGGERGELALGTCEVSIPKDHRIGHLESPSVLRLDFREDPQRHVVLLEVRPQSADDFFSDLKACVAKSAQPAALVFVHGYNVKFADAARRTAQIAYDLKFQGAPIFYSWPSQGKLSGYTVDETNVEWTVPHLRQFLAEVGRRSGARQVHLIAHSMGNRALTSALRDLAREPQGNRPRFREVVLTAPDIDAEIFRRDIAPAIVGTAERVTLYASSHDEALELSKEVHGYPRAGDTDEDLVIVPGVDTIDVSAVDTSLVGHSYYGSNDTVLADIFDLLRENKPPDQRKWLRTQYLGSLKYWIFARR